MLEIVDKKRKAKKNIGPFSRSQHFPLLNVKRPNLNKFSNPKSRKTQTPRVVCLIVTIMLIYLGFYEEEDKMMELLKSMQNARPIRQQKQPQSQQEPEQKQDEKGKAKDQDEEDNGKRGLTDKIQKNRGLRKQRSKKSFQSSRATYREKHRKALIRRAGQVQPMRDNKKRYSGEGTGIKTNVIKSISLQ